MKRIIRHSQAGYSVYNYSLLNLAIGLDKYIKFQMYSGITEKHYNAEDFAKYKLY